MWPAAESWRARKKRYNVAVGKWLSNCRARRKLSIEDLACRSGIELSRLRRIERGTLSPDIDELCKLARPLESTFDDLFSRAFRVIQRSDKELARTPKRKRQISER